MAKPEDPPEWSAPSYASPISDDEENGWNPPDYAKSVNVETAKKPSLFNRIKEAVFNPKPFNPSGIKQPEKEELPNPSSEEHIRAANELKDPGQGSYFKEHLEKSFKNNDLSNFVEGVKAVPKSMYNTVNEIGKRGAEQLRNKDYHGAFETVTSPLMGSVDAVNKRVLETGKLTPETSKEDAKDEAVSQILGIAGLPGKEAIDAYKQGDYARLAGMGLTAAAVAGAFHKIGFSSEKTVSPEMPSIRQNREIPYRAGEPTNLENFGPPKVQAELPIRAPREVLKPETTEIPLTPEAVVENKPLPIRSPNLDPNRFDIEGAEIPISRGKPIEDVRYDLAREKFNMGRDLPTEQPIPEEIPVQKPSFVNPFEKAPVEESIVPKPTAEFAYDWPEAGGKQYNVKGGPFDKSTVGEARLKELGIEVPESSQEIADASLAAKKAAEAKWSAPEYAKSVETLPDITEGFGGSGHPESLNYVANVLSKAGKGEPGLAVEDKEGFQHVTYRGKNGEPIAAAKIVQDQSGKIMVQDLALDKSKGLLGGRAMKVLGEKLMELGATESSGTMSKDAENFMTRMKRRTPEENWKPPPYAESLGTLADETTEMHGGLGGIKPSKRALEPNSGPYGLALDKLFNAMGSMSEKRVQQDVINKAERSKRFSEFSKVEDVGALGASKSLSKLKGDYEKVDLDKLKMTKPQVDSLFTAVKRANITPGEKARGYTTLFKILNGDGVPQRNELRILDEIFGNNFADKITELHGGIGAVGLNLAKMANTMKSMQSSIDLSAPLRQGIGLVHRKEFYPAFRDMFKYFGNKDFYNESMKAIEERPNYLLGREGGLFLAKSDSLMGSEEAFLNSYAGQLPLIKHAVAASDRAYTGFLNKLRADTFDSMIKKAENLGVETSVGEGEGAVPTRETKAIAKFINNATGRGDLGSLNKITNELNTLLWSPRMISSRINMLANPKIYTDLPKGMRLDGLKSLLGIAALGTAVDSLAAYGGAKVGTNILSTDFGKGRFGNKLIDPWGGFQQYIVAAARFLAGKTDDKRPISRMDIAGRFLANKESPAASLAHTLLTSKPTKGGDMGDLTTQYGTKTSVQSEVGKRFVPMFIQDLNEIIQNEPEWSENIGLTAAMAGASALGMGVQSYPEKKPSVFRKARVQ